MKKIFLIFAAVALPSLAVMDTSRFYEDGNSLHGGN